VVAVQRGEHLADFAAEGGQQRKLRHFDDGDVDAAIAGAGGNLETDPSAADDGQRRTFGKRRIQRVGVVDGAQVVHAVGVCAGNRRPAGLRAGGQQQLVVVHGAAVGKGDGVSLRVDRRHLGAELQVDVVIAVPGR
jgi:hypothetical protein